MYRIDRTANRIEPLTVRAFKDLKFEERRHLQEWIAHEPTVLGEDLLIIQKEFNGFSDTGERLDLLALDRQGSLVIIENKLDDAGKDVTWQALKYASYCSTMSTEQIRIVFQQYLDKNGGGSADDLLCDFFDAEDITELSLNKGATQRVILVAANFRKEVTSTVMWLLNYRLRLQCFRATPYSMGDDLFLKVEQVIPTPDTQDFMIGVAMKAQDEIEGVEAEKERHRLRRMFWSKLLKVMNQKTDLFSGISPSKSNWIATSTGFKGSIFAFAVTKSNIRSEIYIDNGSMAENKRIFDVLYGHRAELEELFGGALIWQRLEGKQGCRIKSEFEGSIFDEATWPDMIAEASDAMVRLKAVLERAKTLIN
jgi:hypothetical protein